MLCANHQYEVDLGKLTCTASNTGSSISSGVVTVNLNNGVSANTASLPSIRFSYVQPVVSDFTPKKAPEAGGTEITVTGKCPACNTSVDTCLSNVFVDR